MTVHTNAAYVKNPFFCPFCRSDNIVASKLEFPDDENTVYQQVRCGTCETEWHDIFKLTGYEEVVMT